jgi:hypothetical protein
VDPFSLTVSSPGLLAAGVALSVLAGVAAWHRRPDVPRLALVAGAAALLLLCLSAGGVEWNRPAAREVAVLVDLSASTRPAAFRHREHLENRLRQLLGSTPYRVYAFADTMREIHLPAQPASLPDLPAGQTVLAPPPAAAVLLFSDGQFEAPAVSPPVFAVIDPQLDIAPDAAIVALEQREGMVQVTVRNRGPRRALTLSGTEDPSPIDVGTGSFILTRRLLDDATAITARLDPGDPWPENDLLRLAIPAPARAGWWWIGHAEAPDERWQHLSAAALPLQPVEYLQTAIVVLDNVAADELSTVQQALLHQYVRDLGGALLIIGGDSAHASGGYIGTVLEDLSPLSSAPPAPAVHWILLSDSSGSMAAAADGTTRWQRAEAAMTAAVEHLPPDDLLSIGSFAGEVHWWSFGRSVREAAAERLSPPDLRPHGPTNLEPALRELAGRVITGVQNELLLLTDAEVEIGDQEGLLQMLNDANLRLHVLAVGPGGGEDLLRQIAEQTGGSFMVELEPRQWINGLSQLLRMAMPQRLHDEPLSIQWNGDVSLTGRTAAPWNRTWLKERADLLAAGTADESIIANGTVPAAARWHIGAGEVIATAFAASPAEAAMLSEAIVRLPSDPRFAVSWDQEARLRITIDAIENERFLNNLSFDLELLPMQGPWAADGPTSRQILPIPQTAPGQYATDIASPLLPTIATIRHNGRIIQRLAFAGRYAPEFERIGSNHEMLAELARRSGGDVIRSDHVQPLDLRWPARAVRLRGPLSAAAAALIGVALIAWRLR